MIMGFQNAVSAMLGDTVKSIHAKEMKQRRNQCWHELTELSKTQYSDSPAVVHLMIMYAANWLILNKGEEPCELKADAGRIAYHYAEHVASSVMFIINAFLDIQYRLGSDEQKKSVDDVISNMALEIVIKYISMICE